MLRETYERDLHQLQESILELGNMVEKALNQAVTSLKLQDVVLAQIVINEDKAINQMRYRIEETALTLIATQQPVAHDLRFIASALSLASELERMGDHAKGIARITGLIGKQPLVTPLVNIPVMAEKCKTMLEDALNAYIKDDSESALQIARQDDDIDLLYDTVYKDLLGLMLKSQDNVNGATFLLWAAHNLERFADRIVNICERIVYTASGHVVEITRTGPVNQELTAASASLELEQ